MIVSARLLNGNLLEGRVPEQLYSVGVHGGAIEYVNFPIIYIFGVWLPKFFEAEVDYIYKISYLFEFPLIYLKE